MSPKVSQQIFFYGSICKIVIAEKYKSLNMKFKKYNGQGMNKFNDAFSTLALRSVI